MKFLMFSMAISSSLLVHAQHKDLVGVYRYYNPTDSTYVTLVEKESVPKSWTNKTFLFYAYHEPGPNRIPVYGWYNPVRHSYASIAEGEFEEEKIKTDGYQGKHLQFYALTRQGPSTVKIYRWLNTRKKYWVTVPEGDSSVINDNFHRKTYQYFGIAAN